MTLEAAAPLSRDEGAARVLCIMTAATFVDIAALHLAAWRFWVSSMTSRLTTKVRRLPTKRAAECLADLADPFAGRLRTHT
jgi:hypothetical protein